MAARAGFVVLNRARYAEYATALHDVYQSQLPLYVSVDAVLHAVFKSHDNVLGELEDRALAPRTATMLEAMHQRLAVARTHWPDDVGRDVELYLTVARSLLAGERVAGAASDGDAVARLLVQVQAASSLESVELFGRPHVLDFSAYAPRGHYASSVARTRYFRTAMWLSRTEFNLVSRGSRSSHPGIEPDVRETPREALDALALAELVELAGQRETLALLEEAWRVLAGRREDVSAADLRRLRTQAGITDLRAPDAFARFRTAVGGAFVRTARTHPMPQNVGELPVIATLLGPRVVVDAALLRSLVHDEVPGRYEATVLDVPCALGLERACERLAPELGRFAALRGGLERARAQVRNWPASDDLYSAWLGALRGLAEPPRGARPSFMDTDEGRDLRLNSMVNAWGQLRHNYVLMVARSYDAAGCRIPDAYLEPAVEVYQGLEAYARRGREVVRHLAERGATIADAQSYFETLEQRFAVLRSIAVWERTGRPLPEPMRRYLSMVIEEVPGGSDGPPRYTGWYFDLFRGRQVEAHEQASFLADFSASQNNNSVSWVGAGQPRMGLFVVDVGGASRWMVGPVASAFGVVAPVSRPLNDSMAATLTEAQAPWASGYSLPEAPDPPFAATLREPETDDEGRHTGYPVWVASVRPMRAVELALLDEHRTALAVRTVNVSTRPQRFVLHRGEGLPRQPASSDDPMVSALRVRVGAWRSVLEVGIGGTATGAFGGMRPLHEDYESNPEQVTIHSEGCALGYRLERGACVCGLASGCGPSSMCASGLEMVYVPEGTVQLRGRTVRVPAFCIERTEHAVEASEQLEADAGAGCGGLRLRRGEPRRCLGYGDALRSCADSQSRLPTEAQWLRAFGTAAFPWGASAPEGRRVNLCDQRCRARARLAFSDGFATVAPVGSFLSGASPFGVLQLAGNVAEWIGVETDDPDQLPQHPARRVVLGGSYDDAEPRLLGLEGRREHEVDERDPRIGFRCVWDPARAAQLQGDE